MKRLLLLFCIICFSNVCVQAATDNVLQSIQIDSFKDTYNIILKSDEKPDTKRVITDNNKMMLTIKGVRVSQDLNTIYNATNIDSVTVEPAGNDTVNVMFQAQNVSHANLIFDTLDTPLGVLRAHENQTATANAPKKNKKKIVLSQPMKDYKPVFEEEEDESISLTSMIPSEYASSFISVFKEDAVANTITILLIGLIVLCVARLFRRNAGDDSAQVGLTQSLRDREMTLMQDMMTSQSNYTQSLKPQANIMPEMNYGLKTYQNAVKTQYQQNGMTSPYMTKDVRFNNANMQPKRPVAPNTVPNNLGKSLQDRTPVGVSATQTRRTTQAGMQQKLYTNNSRMTLPQNKVTNLESMKFLDSMAQIYEKNGRADLAQGLKSKMNRV